MLIKISKSVILSHRQIIDFHPVQKQHIKISTCETPFSCRKPSFTFVYFPLFSFLLMLWSYFHWALRNWVLFELFSSIKWCVSFGIVDILGRSCVRKECWCHWTMSCIKSQFNTHKWVNFNRFIDQNGGVFLRIDFSCEKASNLVTIFNKGHYSDH